MNIQPWSWLYLTCFLDLFGASMIMPVFSSHLKTLGISHGSVGLLSSLYGTSQLLSSPIIGSWSDVNGRQTILCLSLIICSIAYGLMGIISSFYMFLIIRFLLGLFKHTQTLCKAFTADIVPAEKQATVHGLMNAFTSFSFMIGPVISGHIMEIENGFKVLTTSVSLIFILNVTVVMVFAKTEQSSKISQSNKNNILQKITEVFRELYVIEWSGFWPLFTIKFLFTLTGVLFFQNMGIILTEHFKLVPRYIGYTIAFYGFISCVCNLCINRIKRIFFLNKSPLKSLTFTFSVMTMTLYILYRADSYPIFVVGLIPLASSQALSRILMTEMVLDSSDENFRGSMMGASSSLSAVARILAPTLGGLITSWGGVSAPLMLSAVIAASAAILTVIYSYPNYKKFR